MVSRAEQSAASALRAVLADLPVGADLPDSPALRELQSSLERFLPEVLSAAYPAAWRFESLDALRLGVARKIGPRDAMLIGLGLLVSDQSWTPLHAELALAPDADVMAGVRCKLGEGPAPPRRRAYDDPSIGAWLQQVSTRALPMGWTYVAQRGELLPTPRIRYPLNVVSRPAPTTAGSASSPARSPSSPP